MKFEPDAGIGQKGVFFKGLNKEFMKYSIIVLLEIEEIHHGSIRFIEKLYELFSNKEESFEVIVIANGVGDYFRNEIKVLLSQYEKIKAIEFNVKTTQAVCLKSALKETSGETNNQRFSS